MTTTSSDAIAALAWARQATRDFGDAPVDREALARAFAVMQRAPSGYNLQPWCAVVVDAPEQRADLHRACLDQRQIGAAPLTVVFAIDTAPARRLPVITRQGVAEGHWPAAYARDFLQRYVRLRLGLGPLAPFASLGARLVGLVRPAPDIAASHAARAAWANKQLGIAVGYFLLACEAEGLATCPMEGFDPGRVRRLVGLDRRWLPSVVVPIGHAAARGPQSSRLPREAVVWHANAGAPWRPSER